MTKSPPVAVVETVEHRRDTSARTRRDTAPTPGTVLGLVQGGWTAQAICVAAELGLADELAFGPLPLDQLARRVQADPDALRRLLRLLTSYGIFIEHADGRYGLSPSAEPLRADTPASLRDAIRFFGNARQRRQWSHLTDAVCTGEPVCPDVDGMPFFDLVRHDQDFGGLFHAAMTSISRAGLDPILDAYDFSGFRTIVDVGGGTGRLLTEILSRAPESNGILFDLPEVVAEVRPLLRALSLTDRCRLEGGSFLDTIPAGGDTYILKHVIHDWPDAEARRILANIRRVMEPDARLLLIELVLPGDNRRHPGKLLDLQMLLTTGGRERTEPEYRQFLADCGFEFVRDIPTLAADHILEFRKALEFHKT